jgi:hypothetical protein
MPNLIAQALSSVTLGSPVLHGSLTMFPLIDAGDEAADPFYLTLDAALAAGQTDVTEVSDQGSVPALLVVNRAPQPVFILDGEELVGAKQNRVVNLSILVPANATLTIPVSCVEAGRWRARTRGFSSSPRTQYAAGRAKRLMQVSVSLRTSGRRESDQAEVWADIADKSSRLDARSATGAMEEIFSRHAAFTDDAVEAFRPCAHQCGAVFLIGGRVAAMDLFDCASTLKWLLPKLVRSVAIDALDSREESAPVALPLRTRIAEHFLALVSDCSQQVCDAVGVGQDIRLEAHHVAGAALAVDGEVVHLAAFHT